MADICHDFLIHSSPERVFEAVSRPAGLDNWWTRRSKGEPEAGSTYELWFGPQYDWRAVVRVCVPASRIEWELTEADKDWEGTRVGFRLNAEGDGTQVRFRHAGWAEENSHYRVSCYCWAMYLRILKRFVEHGETVPYEQRLEA